MIKIEKMKEKHIKKVAEIESLCIETPWGFEQIKAELNNEKATYFCAVFKNEVVGYVGVWNVLGEGNITNIAVHPDFQGKKIGYSLLTKLIEYAKNEGFEFLTLEVNEENKKAIALYEKCNFEVIGRRKKYYHNKNDAILMNYNI